jgi:UrcA family protein
MFSKTTFAAVAALSLFAGVSTASAATPSTDTVSVTVSYEGLDLNSDAGARIMLQRIAHAAGEVCGSQPDTRLLDQTHAYKSCMTSVTNRAVDKLGSAKVSVFAGRSSPTTMAYNSGR